MSASRHSAVTLLLLALANLLNYVDRSIFTVVLEPIKAELDLTDANVGLLVGAISLLYAVVGVAMGFLADHFNRARLLSIAIAIWSLMTAAGGAARNFAELFIARVGVGVGEAACLPIGVSLIGDTQPSTRRTAAVALFNGSAMVGSMLGLVLMGYLAERLGWRAALVVVGLPGLLLALAVARWLLEPRLGGGTPQEFLASTQRAEYGLLLRRPTFLIWLTALPMLSLALNVVNLWGPTFFARTHGLPLGEVGLHFGLTYGLGAALGTLAGGLLSLRMLSWDRRWDFWLPALSAALAIPVYRAAFAEPNADTAFLLTGLGAFVGCLGYGPAVSCVHWVAGPAVRGAAVALGMASAALVGMFAGPWLVGALADHYEPLVGKDALGVAMRMAILAFAPAAALFWLGTRYVARDSVE